jgi:cytochrome c553
MRSLILASLLVTHIACAAGPNLNGQRLTATCANCHGTNGISAGGALPSLAGQSKDALVSSMKAFKVGTRQATIMHQIAKGYTDEQIESIAAYLAAQKK